MAKDPAFLFYSKDFYEGTRTMLPKERACYIDLLIYQHQHGYIPNDIERITMYCNGIDEATLQATLQAKFKQCDQGWYNEKLTVVIENRKEFSDRQSSNGVVGQFFKKAKSVLNQVQYKSIREYVYNDYGKDNLSIELKKEGVTHEAMLEAMLKHLAIVIVNANSSLNNKGVAKNSIPSTDRIPDLETFIAFGLEKASANRLNVTRTALSMKYEAWKEAGWVNGNGQEVKNWKASLINTLPHIKSEPVKEQQKFVPRPPVIPKQP